MTTEKTLLSLHGYRENPLVSPRRRSGSVSCWWARTLRLGEGGMGRLWGVWGGDEMRGGRVKAEGVLRRQTERQVVTAL